MKHKKRNIVVLIFLAVICIAGAELAACRYFEPELYQQITAPVRHGFHTAAAFCQRTRARISSLYQDLTASEDDLPASQLAGEPELKTDTPISDPSVTELLEIDGQQILTGGTIQVVYFHQADETWANEPYGTDDIGRYGCGPSAMAMAVSSMTDNDCNPTQMAQWAVERGHWAKKSGSYLSIVNDASQFGLEVESLKLTPEAMCEALLSGKMLVALMGPGHFTNGGHFILIRAVTLSGEVLVADPNSLERSLTTWDPQLILDELSASTAHGAPLWALSLPTD